MMSSLRFGMKKRMRKMPTVEEAIEFQRELQRTVTEHGHAVAYAKAYEVAGDNPELLALVTVLNAA